VRSNSASLRPRASRKSITKPRLLRSRPNSARTTLPHTCFASSSVLMRNGVRHRRTIDPLDPSHQRRTYSVEMRISNSHRNDTSRRSKSPMGASSEQSCEASDPFQRDGKAGSDFRGSCAAFATYANSFGTTLTTWSTNALTVGDTCREAGYTTCKTDS
jgi:hypothetical protein